MPNDLVYVEWKDIGRSTRPEAKSSKATHVIGDPAWRRAMIRPESMEHGQAA
jgi:hypothetical protein